MATVYSDASWTGNYTYTRVKVDYSGRTATATLLYTRTNDYSGATGSGSATFTFGGQSVGFNVTFYGRQTDAYCASLSFPISAGGGTYSGDSTGGYIGGSWSVSIPSQRTAPRGLSASNIRPSIESFTGTVSVTSWGDYVEDWNKYRELQVWTYNASSLVEPRRYQPTAQTSDCPLSGDITVTNSSGGTLTITGNTRYTLGCYASNGYASVGSQRIGDYVTLPYADTVSFNSASSNAIVLNYSVPASGGFYSQALQYSIDNGSTWQTGITITGSSAQSGTFSVGGLNANTQYTIRTRVTTTAGTTNGNTVTASTIGPNTPTISVVNDSNTYSTQQITYGTTTFGGGTGGKVFLYGNTTTPPTTLITFKTTTGNSTYNNTGLAGNQIYYYRARAGAIFGSGKNYFVVPSSTTGRVNDNQISVTKTKSATTSGATSLVSVPVQLEPNTTYTISYNKTITGDTLNRTGNIRLNIDGSWTNTWDSTGTLTFTTGGRGEMIFGFYSYFNETAAGSNTVTWSNIQVEKGSSKTTFVGHNVDYVMSDYSPIVNLVTRLPRPTIQSGAVVQYETATTVKVRLNVRVPADNGYYNTKDVFYRYSTDSGSTWSAWTSGATVNANTQTNVNVDISSLAVDTLYRFQIVTRTPGQSNSSNSHTLDLRTSGQHQGPTNFDFTVADNQTAIQTWLSSFSGYTNPIFIQGKSRAKVTIPRATEGTTSDGATLVNYTFNATVDNKSLQVNWVASGTMSGTYALPTPSRRATELSSNQFPIIGIVKDSLDTTSQVTKNILSLSWAAPTITGEAERLSARGKALVRFSGKYARLQAPSLNNGEDTNTITIQYRVIEDEQTVIQDWQTTTNYTTSINPDKPFQRDFSGNITLEDLPVSTSYIIQLKISDHFNTATTDIPMEIWDNNQVLYPPQYDIELWDWRTGTFVADLSNLVVGDLEITWQLNDVEEVSFDMDLLRYEEKCQEMNIDPTTLLVPYKYDIKIRRNGIYILGCNLVEANIVLPNNPPAKIQVKGTGFLNLFKDQYILGETMSEYTYAQIARRLVTRAQQPDCIVKNPTLDIDTSYWLASEGTLAWVDSEHGTYGHEGGGFIANQRSGTGWLCFGTQMTVEAGTPLKLDVWVKGQSGVTISAVERSYITTATNQYSVANLTANGNWQHLTGSWNAKFTNGYITFQMNRTNTTTRLCVDDCFVFRADDDTTYCNLHVPLGTDTASSTQDNNRAVDYELQNVKDAIMDLTSMEDDNFDFEFLPDRTFNVYRRKGADKLNLEVCYPGNIESMTIQQSASNLANKVIGIGSGIGDERLQYMTSDLSSRQLYGTHETVMNNSNISLLDTLVEKSNGELADRKFPVVLPSVVIKDGSINPLLVETGDTLLVELQKDSYLASVTNTYRVMKIQCSVSEDAVETMTLTFERA